MAIPLRWAADQIAAHVSLLFSLTYGLSFNWCAQNGAQPVAGTSAFLCAPCG